MIDTLDLQKYFKEPIDYNCRTLFNHLGRYFYAIQKLKITKNDVVMDCSCGQGYGSYNLALNCDTVYGLDINKNYIKIAENNFKLNNLIFLSYDELDLNYIEANKIICIETIEHLKNIDEIEIFIEKLIEYSTMNNSDILLEKIFLSFPIGNNSKSDYNEFHLCEPDIKSIHDILKKHFSIIEIETSKFVNNYDKECEYCYMWGSK